MIHEVFILGGQRIDQKSKKDGREARGNEEREKRERIEKGSREGIPKDRREGGPERPPLLEFLDPTRCCSHCFFKSSGYDKLELKHQNLFLQAYRKHYFNVMV